MVSLNYHREWEGSRLAHWRRKECLHGSDHAIGVASVVRNTVDGTALRYVPHLTRHTSSSVSHYYVLHNFPTLGDHF